MKKLLSMLTMFLIFVSLNTQATVPGARNTSDQKAVLAFQKFVETSSDLELKQQIDFLNENGFVTKSQTTAVKLSGVCGFAGCSSNYLVTTQFHTQGANTQTATIAGLVKTHTLFEEGEVKKVISRESMEELTNN